MIIPKLGIVIDAANSTNSSKNNLYDYFASYIPLLLELHASW